MFERGLQAVVETALRATPPEFQADMYQRLDAACQEAFKCVFPDIGPWGVRRPLELPPTPILDHQSYEKTPPLCVFEDRTEFLLPAEAKKRLADLKPADGEAPQSPTDSTADEDGNQPPPQRRPTPEELAEMARQLRERAAERQQTESEPEPSPHRQVHDAAVNTALALGKAFKRMRILSRKKRLATKKASRQKAPPSRPKKESAFLQAVRAELAARRASRVPPPPSSNPPESSKCSPLAPREESSSRSEQPTLAHSAPAPHPVK
jgi:hypothetical protein